MSGVIWAYGCANPRCGMSRGICHGAHAAHANVEVAAAAFLGMAARCNDPSGVTGFGEGPQPRAFVDECISGLLDAGR